MLELDEARELRKKPGAVRRAWLRFQRETMVGTSVAAEEQESFTLLLVLIDRRNLFRLCELLREEAGAGSGPGPVASEKRP